MSIEDTVQKIKQSLEVYRSPRRAMPDDITRHLDALNRQQTAERYGAPSAEVRKEILDNLKKILGNLKDLNRQHIITIYGLPTDASDADITRRWKAMNMRQDDSKRNDRFPKT